MQNNLKRKKINQNIKTTERRIVFHSWHFIIIILLGTIVGSLLVGTLVQKNPFFVIFDRNLYIAIHGGVKSPILDALIKPVNYNFLPRELSPYHMPSYFYIMILGTLGYLALFRRNLVIWAVLAFLIGTILTILISAIDWHFVYRSRPFVTLPNTVDDFGKRAWQNFSSYPSGHSRDTALYSTIIFSFIPILKWPLIIFSLFVAYSRVYLGAHYPTDVIVGVLMGLLIGKVTINLIEELKILLSLVKKKGRLEDAKQAK